MEPVTVVLGGLVVAFGGGLAGRYMGTNNYVKKDVFEVKQNLLLTKISTIDEKVDKIIEALGNMNITII